MAATPRRARRRAPPEDSVVIIDDSGDDTPSELSLHVLNLRKCWELASVLNFWQVFRPVIQSGMEVSSEEIEEALVMPNETLAKLHIALLKGIPPLNKSLKDPDGWVLVLSKKLAPWWPWVAEGQYPFVTAHRAELSKYKDFDPKTRLLILKALCEIRALQDDILWYIDDALKHGSQISNFQKNRIGSDQNGAAYWYDGDSVVGYRLYREINKAEYNHKIKGLGGLATDINCHWETLATNLKEFLNISDKLASSKIRVEAAVGHYLKSEVIPVLQKEQKKKERKLKKQRQEEIILGAFHNTVGINRPRRGCRPVSYTYDEYDRCIEEAIKMSKKGRGVQEQKDDSEVENNNIGCENILANGRDGYLDDRDDDYKYGSMDDVSEELNSAQKMHENGVKRNTRGYAAMPKTHQAQQLGLRRSARTAVCSTNQKDEAFNMGVAAIAQTKKRLSQRPTLNSDIVLQKDSDVEEIVDDSLDERPETAPDSEESSW